MAQLVSTDTETITPRGSLCHFYSQKQILKKSTRVSLLTDPTETGCEGLRVQQFKYRPSNDTPPNLEKTPSMGTGVNEKQGILLVEDGFYISPANGACDPNSNGKWVGTAADVGVGRGHVAATPAGSRGSQLRHTRDLEEAPGHSGTRLST